MHGMEFYKCITKGRKMGLGVNSQSKKIINSFCVESLFFVQVNVIENKLKKDKTIGGLIAGAKS